MFNIGGGELIVIMVIALIVLGPQRLPDAARQIGKTMGDLRRLSSGFQNEMKQALDTADDPNRVAGRRNVLAKDAATPPAEGGAVYPVEPVASSIAAVSAQPSTPAPDTTSAAPGPSTPSAPGKTTPPARQARTQALKAAPAGKAPAAKKAPPVAKNGTPAKKATAAKKSAGAAKKTTKVVPKPASPRTPS